jgi:hypothetical protein
MIKSEGLGKQYRKVTITLGEEQENFIDDIRKEIKKNDGYRLGRTEIIRTAIQFLKHLKINSMNLSGIKNEDDLLDKIKRRHSK